MNGLLYAQTQVDSLNCSATSVNEAGDLEKYFQSNTEGPGIWKWKHYFPIYERHLSKFREQPVRLCEIGIYSGGSIGMWKNYFGGKCRVIGVDIEEACREYADEQTEILIGDQADRCFWKRVRESNEKFDIVIDDGGHLPHQQIVTFEELLPHINSGGVYICEDVHGVFNEFNAYINGFSQMVDSYDVIESPNDKIFERVCLRSSIQRRISSIHRYPYVTVVEFNEIEEGRLGSIKRGTSWQPFLK